MKPHVALIEEAIHKAGKPYSRGSIGALMDAMWATFRTDDSTPGEKALLSGMALAALRDFHATLPEEEDQNAQP